MVNGIMSSDHIQTDTEEKLIPLFIYAALSLFIYAALATGPVCVFAFRRCHVSRRRFVLWRGGDFPACSVRGDRFTSRACAILASLRASKYFESVCVGTHGVRLWRVVLPTKATRGFHMVVLEVGS
jgi:hypothetical protein